MEYSGLLLWDLVITYHENSKILLLYFSDIVGLTQTKVLSVDHTPEVKSEKDRIIRNGGRVRSALNQHGSSNGPLRVWLKTTNSPGLAMTRSIGDLVAERVGVTWKPEIAIYKLGPHDHSLIVASDGVWDVFSNHEVLPHPRMHFCWLI